MAGKTQAEIQHLVNLAGITVNMIRHPGFMTDLVASDDGERQSVQTCLEILADTAVVLMRQHGIKPRYRLRAITRPHGGAEDPGATG